MIAGYEVRQELGRGSASVVFLARQRLLNRPVALKRLLIPGDEIADKRFLRSAEVTARMSHSNIGEIFDLFLHDGTLYLVMEYLEGGSLRSFAGRLSFEQLAGVMEAALAGLEHAASQGVVHRDLKPENLLLDRDGRVKIVDFSIAQVTRLEPLTPPGTTLGTPRYMSPEQGTGQPLDVRSDLYALGCIALELVTGRVPQDDAVRPVEMMHRRLNEPAPALVSVDPTADHGLSAWVARLLAIDRSVRHPTAAAAWEELERHVVRACGPDWRNTAALPGFTPVPTRLQTFELQIEPSAPGAPSTEKCPACAADAPPDRDFCPACGTYLRWSDTAAAASVPAPEPPSAPPLATRPDEAPRWDAPVDAEPPAAPVAQPEALPPWETMSPRDVLPTPVPPAQSPVPRAPSDPPADGELGPPPTPPRRGSRWRRFRRLDALKQLEHSWAEASIIATTSSPTADVVDCTVFAPPQVQPGARLMLQVFAHTVQQAPEVERAARGFDAASRARGVHSLAEPIDDGATLTFELRLPGLRVDGPVQSLVWRGEPRAVQFDVTVPADARAPAAVIGTVIVRRDLVPIGQIKFKLEIITSPVETLTAPRPVGEQAIRYRHAFLSYASEDRAQVLDRAQMLRLLRIEYFHDLMSLEPGERWERELYRQIESCDLFLLFWSEHAQSSPWVRREALHALSLCGADHSAPPQICPVIVSGPPVAEPWTELAHLHFNDALVYVRAAVAPPAR